MKKLLYMFAAGMAFAACQPDNAYKVTGTIEGLNEGDTVLLQQVDGRKLIPIDTAFIADGQFAFTGTTDACERLCITYKDENSRNGQGRVYLFLEKGNISVAVTAEKDEVVGTANNDIMNRYNTAIGERNEELNKLYRAKRDTTLTDDARKALNDEFDAKVEDYNRFIAETVKANIATHAGIHLFGNNYSDFELAEVEEMLAAVPAELQAHKTIARIKEYVALEKRTAVGQPFIDFALNTPEGETVKLSDFIQKNKVTLVDFWASWCGPCRSEMPHVVKAYNAYKDKGFGIVGVSLDNDAEAWKKGIKDLDITWPQMSDLKGWQCEGAKVYGVTGIPATYLINQEGIIIGKNLRGAAIEEKLKEVLK